MTTLQWLILSGTGLIAGIGSGLFGIGGGVIMVPLLYFVYGLDFRTASATSLLAMILPVGLLGVWEYHKAGVLQISHLKMGLIISVGLFVGAFLGSKISIALPTKAISKGFALLLVYVAFRLWFQDNK